MNRSETTAALAGALAKAQGAMRAAELDRENPFFKSRYATLASVWEAIRKPLSENELAVSQVTYPDNGHLILETVLLHSSGEWISAQLIVKPVKDDPQGIGSAISYARRYGLSAIVSAVSDEDDDGNEASKKEPERNAAAPAKTAASKPAQASTKAEAPEPAGWEDLTPAQEERAAQGSIPDPSGMTSQVQLIAWAMTTGAFEHRNHALNAWDVIKREQKPVSFTVMRAMWIADVQKRAEVKRQQPELLAEEAKP